MKQGIIFSGLVIGLCLVFTMGCSSPGDGGGGEPIVALDEDFEDSSSSLWMAKGVPYGDNGTIGALGGHDNCIMIHADSELLHGTIGVESQFDLGAEVPYDMSGEDYTISFDVYVTAASFALMEGFQFSFWDSDFTPIYSDYLPIIADTWVTIQDIPIDTTSAYITWSGMGDAGKSDPDDWQFHVVRFQFVTAGAGADTEVLFYLDNIVVERP